MGVQRQSTRTSRPWRRTQVERHEHGRCARLLGDRSAEQMKLRHELLVECAHLAVEDQRRSLQRGERCSRTRGTSTRDAGAMPLREGHPRGARTVPSRDHTAQAGSRGTRDGARHSAGIRANPRPATARRRAAEPTMPSANCAPAAVVGPDGQRQTLRLQFARPRRMLRGAPGPSIAPLLNHRHADRTRSQRPARSPERCEECCTGGRCADRR
jgi:hypothetical protein